MSTVAGPRRLALLLPGADELPVALVEHCLRHVAGDGATELHALFVVDSELLKAAALPFTSEFCTLTSKPRPLEPAALEAHYASQARRAERACATLAVQGGVSSRFEVWREPLARVLAAALEAADAALLPTPPVLHGQRPTPAAPVLAVIMGDAAGERALALARGVAAAAQAPLEILHLAAAGAAAGGLTRALARRDVQLVVCGAALAPDLLARSGGSALLVVR